LHVENITLLEVKKSTDIMLIKMNLPLVGNRFKGDYNNEDEDAFV
jgi:hypothetical protein